MSNDALQRELTEARALLKRQEFDYRAALQELQDNRDAMLFMLEDLENARKKIERSHQEWMVSLDVVDDLIFLHDKKYRVLRCNKAYRQCAGIPFHEIIGKPYYDIFPKTGFPLSSCLHVMGKAEAAADEEEISFGDTIYRSRAYSSYDEQGVYLHSVHVLEDITQHKQSELALQRSNRALRTLSEGNSSLIRATDELKLLQAICRVAVGEGGYRMAWVGYLEQDAERSIRPVAQDGFDEGYLEQARITWADSERGQGPTGRAARSGKIQAAQNIALDPNMSPWRAEAAKHGYASSIALPLMENEKCFGVLTIYASEAEAFNAAEIALLEEMADDLAFGILTLRLKQAHREHEQRLNKNMLQTVAAIASIVEMRDHYTSGHQMRVAELARAIAKQMGLSEEDIQPIHLAGLVHDLGKISTPAEILSKPGRLNDLEYSLIKLHPQAGYDILKDIDFSWPIAQMVWQHHERMDGSGYPQGLKGEDILLGARILSVADVVEAMTTHRPYRPGLGIAAALDEITRARGLHYDAQVVDACVALFKEQNYSFE